MNTVVRMDNVFPKPFLTNIDSFGIVSIHRMKPVLSANRSLSVKRGFDLRSAVFCLSKDTFQDRPSDWGISTWIYLLQWSILWLIFPPSSLSILFRLTMAHGKRSTSYPFISGLGRVVPMNKGVQALILIVVVLRRSASRDIVFSLESKIVSMLMLINSPLSVNFSL